MKKTLDLWVPLNKTKKKLLIELKITLLVIVLSATNVLAFPLADLQQQIVISGTITDAATGEAMVGVNIQVQGKTIGSISDINGKYSLPSVDQNAILLFSFIGYVSQEVAVQGRTRVDVALVSEIKGLDEVIVVGYGTEKKATITGSISAVSGAQLVTSPSINISNSLAGRLPGLVSVSRSGEPGADNAILRIRGSNTLGDNSPLIVVDGISNRSLQGINSEDIESITILKDASAAIYGAQAANGVILVTTKRGVVGKPLLTLDYNQGFSKPTVLPKMADAATYAQMVNEVQSYRGRDPQYSAAEIQSYKDGSDPWLYPNTDWFKAVYKPSSMQNNLNILLSGGSDRLNLFLFSRIQISGW